MGVGMAAVEYMKKVKIEVKNVVKGFLGVGGMIKMHNIYPCLYMILLPILNLRFGYCVQVELRFKT